MQFHVDSIRFIYNLIPPILAMCAEIPGSCELRTINNTIIELYDVVGMIKIYVTFEDGEKGNIVIPINNIIEIKNMEEV